MYKKSVLIGGVLILALVLMGAGCGNNAQDSTNTAVVEESQEYVWAEQGLTFKYPTRLAVSKMAASNNILFFVPADVAPADVDQTLADTGYPTAFTFYNNNTVDGVLEFSFSDGGLKTKTEETIGGRTFTKITYDDSYTNTTDVYYLLPFKDGVLTYKEGEEGYGNAQLILSSLQF